MHEQVQGSS
jgi:hypothetical protein